MKKMAKSLLCLVLALSLVFALAACGCGKNAGEAEDKLPAEPIDAAEETVNNAIAALLEFDFEALGEYTTDPDAFMSFAGLGDITSLVESFAGEELTEEQTEMISELFKKILTFIDVEIVSSELVDEAKAVFTVSVSYPDFESIDIESYLSEDDVMNAFSNVLAEYGYTLEDMNSITDEAEIEELSNAMVEVIFDVVIDAMAEAAKDAEIISETSDLTVVLENGKWLIQA